ncbi:zinc finger CCCH domain-containing protein 17-like [Salvia splendens]|uniref:zinc finger CCCH domain-containing protein 17-like n=1 Tax=Salvia splendens TaxID=180675 RepID=UPI001C2771A3|nr:zinc finger CCCH domain-containing protein 17-like [Salvia splendens]
MATSAPQSQSQPPSAEEELLKRNTDCVYFLASPLTCKKGSECEYRHSDVARVNPRDCWYWLNGNCLSPKCAFRHPPLEGYLGTQGPTSTGPSAPVPQAVPGPSHVPTAFAKPAAACVFFQKGHCLKGDWCPFLHAPSGSNTKPVPVPATGSAVEPVNISNPSSGVDKTLQQKVTSINVAKSLNDTARAKPLAAVESTAPRYEYAVSRKAPQTSVSNLFSGYRTSTPGSNGHPISWSNRAQQSHLLDEPESMNNNDAEEVSREPSPGFDVLVDDDGRDSEFYPGEDRYGMSREHEPGREYEIGRSADYSLIAAVDDENYWGRHRYDSLEHRKGQYAWEQHRTSSERMSGGSYHERRPYGRQESHGQVDEHDLRHRLTKHKMPNGLRSVISHEHDRDVHVRDRTYRSSHRDEQHNTLRENSLGGRLRGRIRLPERSSSPNNRDMIRTTDRIASQSGRIRDRIKGRPEEASNDGAKNYRGPDSRRDFVGENNGDFAKPKSLAELKNQKNADSSRQHVTDQQALGKRKSEMNDWHQQSENDLSFEGPKPLQEILKRKRRETSGTVVGRNSPGIEGVIGDKSQEEKEGAIDGHITLIGNHKEVDKPISVQTMEAGEGKLASSSSDKQSVPSKPEAEDGELGDDGVGPESEPYEQRDKEFDYEQMGEEEYVMYDDGENGDAIEEYVDEEEEDDDEFAKKMGVMYS